MRLPLNSSKAVISTIFSPYVRPFGESNAWLEALETNSLGLGLSGLSCEELYKCLKIGKLPKLQAQSSL